MGSILDSTWLTVLFLVATFAGAVVAGLAGFAFGLVAAAVWLHMLTPLQTVTLVIWFGLIIQSYAVWKLRSAIRWRRIAPLLLGASFGVPLGIVVLANASPYGLQTGVAAVLILYGLYGLFGPSIRPLAPGGVVADTGVGFINGMVGGATGLAGVVATIWCQLRGWPRDQQRTVFQPVAVGTFLMSTIWLGGQGSRIRDVIPLFVLGLPAVLLGTGVGLKCYGRLNEAQFRTIVLVLLLASGVALLIK